MECLEHSELDAFLDGSLPEEQVVAFASHCDSCPECQRLLETLGGNSDTIMDAIRKGMPDIPFVTETSCSELMEKTVLGPTQTQEHFAVAKPLQGQLGQYEILDLLGQGGMGAVYKARHLKLKRTVALKLLPDHRMWPEDIARFEREMASVGQLNHPNIVTAHDAGELDGHHYLAMELLDGTDLSKLQRSHGPLSVGAACELIRQAALGLHYAHEHGMVHRDIKPSNLMLTKDGTVKVLDLGLARLQAKASEEDGPELTSTGDVMGTIDYMASEQGDDSTRVGPAADIYSLGATLHKLLTGTAPYSGDGLKTMMQKMRALAMEDPPSIKTRRTDLPAELVALVDCMTRRDPQKRPETMADVAKRLEPFADPKALPSLLPGSRPVQVAVAERPTALVQSVGGSVSSRGRGSKRNLWLAIIGIGAIAVALMFALPPQIRVGTKSGTIIIETAGGEVPVTITGETASFVDKTDGETVLIKVDHDKKQLVFQKEGFKSIGRDFNVKFPEGQRVAIHFEPKLDKGMEPTGPDLIALLKMVRAHGGFAEPMNGAIDLDFPPDHDVTLSAVAALIKRSGIQIGNLTISSEEDLKEFVSNGEWKTKSRPGIPITRLLLRGHKITDQAVPTIFRINPNYLTLTETNITDAGVQTLLSKPDKQWGQFRLNGAAPLDGKPQQFKLSQNTIKKLKGQKELLVLAFEHCTGLEDQDLAALKDLKKLDKLQFIETVVSLKALESVGQISSLRSLTMQAIHNGEQITSKDLQPIIGLRQLKLLVLSHATAEQQKQINDALPLCRLFVRKTILEKTAQKK